MLATGRNIALIAITELKRIFVTRRGLISLLTFALVWGLLLVVVIRRAPALIASGTTFGSLLNSDAILSLAKWQVAEFGLFWLISLYLLPFFSVAFSADQTASDKTRGTLKLLTLHTSRASIVIGRFAGMMLVQCLLIALALCGTLLIAALRDVSLLPAAIENAVFIWVNLIIMIAPFTALMAVFSLVAKSAMQAINYATILWILLFFAISIVSNYLAEASLLKNLLPGGQISDLAAHYSWQSLHTFWLPLLQTLAYLAGGLFIIYRIDL